MTITCRTWAARSPARVVRARAKRIGGDGVESLILKVRPLLKLGQRFGIEAGQKADLGPTSRTVGVHALGLVEQSVDLVERDVVDSTSLIVG